MCARLRSTNAPFGVEFTDSTWSGPAFKVWRWLADGEHMPAEPDENAVQQIGRCKACDEPLGESNGIVRPDRNGEQELVCYLCAGEGS